MFCLKKYLLLVAAFALATANPSSTTANISTETTYSSTEPKQLMQVQIMEVDRASSDSMYHYICYAGVSKTGHVMCAMDDTMQYDTPHDVEVKLRCPGTGSGKAIAYVEVQAWLTSQALECQIIEGGIGQGFIGLRLAAYNTLALKYDSVVQSYN